MNTYNERRQLSGHGSGQGFPKQSGILNTGIAVFALTICILIITHSLHSFVRDNSLTSLQQSSTIRIGYAVEAPYAFLTTDGEVTGESPEIAKRVARQLGFNNIIWRQTEFGDLLDELEAGRIDVIAAGMFVTPVRHLARPKELHC